MKYRMGVWLSFFQREAPEPEWGHESFEDFLDEVMEHLLDNDDVEDPSVGGSLARLDVEIALTLTLPDDATTEHVVEGGMAAIRSAIHAARGGTPDWPTFREGDFTAGPLQPA
ncbi:MAG TPA: hypothetical protein VM324_08600 [Egibacteraceae bacterium]|jgi:hypothetical protein|nr:hypothetical protein [Egibacteraceae bacterium]